MQACLVGGIDSQIEVWPRSQRGSYVSTVAPAAGVGSVLHDGRFHTSGGGTSALTKPMPQNAPNPVFEAYDKWAAANGKVVPETKKAAEPDDHDFGVVPVLLLIGGVLVIALIGVVGIVLVARSRKKPVRPVAQWPIPQPGSYQGVPPHGAPGQQPPVPGNPPWQGN